MAGTAYFKTAGLIRDQSDQDTAQAVFKSLWDFFKHLETNAVATEIARNNGSASTYANPLGTDYYHGAEPFGEGAWAVFLMVANGGRTAPYYVFLAWSAGSGSFDNAPNFPGLIRGGTGSDKNVGIQMATAFDSGGSPASPWPAAATGSMGSDTKQDPVWDEPASGELYVWPLSNTEGDHTTSRENCAPVLYSSAASNRYRYYFVGDEDNLALMHSEDTDDQLDAGLFMGMYQALDEVVVDLPLFMFQRTGAPLFEVDQPIGSITGSTSSEGGLARLRNGALTRLQLPDGGNITATGSPNMSYDPSAGVGQYPIVLAEVPPTTDAVSQVGWMDPTFWRVVHGRGHMVQRADGTWIVMRASTTEGLCYFMVPWNDIAPKAVFTEAGVTS